MRQGKNGGCLHSRFCANSFMLGGGGGESIFVVRLGIAVGAEEVCYGRAGRARGRRIGARISRRASRGRRGCHLDCMTRKATGGGRCCCRSVLTGWNLLVRTKSSRGWDFAVRVDTNYTRRDLDVPRKEYECNGYGCRGNGWTRTWRGSSTHVMASNFL